MKKLIPLRRSRIATLTLMSVLIQHALPVLAADNEFQPYTIPDKNPEQYSDIEKVVIEGESDDPKKNIHENLKKAFSGGWDWDIDVNGVFEQQEPVCPPTVDEPIGAHCEDSGGIFWTKTNNNEWTDADGTSIQGDAAMEANAKKTIESLGVIPKVEGVPGRDTARAFGNIRSGLGMRREEEGNAKSILFSPAEGRRVYKDPEEFTGLDYPNSKVNTCGLTTLCRPPGHPDLRKVPRIEYQTAPRRDIPKFFCPHACQRPLDDDGKPANWDEEDSTEVECGKQEPYPPEEQQIKYSCGGGETKGPDDGFCQELSANGQLGGLCQDMNNWVYILWKKLKHVCLVPSPKRGLIPKPIYIYQKGDCGFPAEVEKSDSSKAKRDDGWDDAGKFECCSDDPYSTVESGAVYDLDHKGTSCKPCIGDNCRLFPETNEVIINDVWYEPFPKDLLGECNIPFPTDTVARLALIAALKAIGNPQANIGVWNMDDDNLRKQTQDREYISYFREYDDASYERSPVLRKHVTNDDFKKEHIPVACYGMYDLAPEDAKTAQTQSSDKRCTIAAYYDDVNFQNMKETQRGTGKLNEMLGDNPFGNPLRPFTQNKDLWWPELRGSNVNLGAFSMINDEVFANTFHGDFSFALLTTDSAKQRATVQLDVKRLLSNGALIRTPDDTITIEKDVRKHRRTMVEWWHIVETEMHKNLTIPTVRLLLPTTWTIDLNPLDPLYTAPEPPKPGELSPDIRSEPIEVQVQAHEDLLGDVVSFMERALLLRIEGEPVPIVVPIINPTELRAIAQGWEVWGKKQNGKSLPGGPEALAVAAMLLDYADQADKVRKLRAQLPRYAGEMLKEQKKITQKLADWLQENIRNFRVHLLLQNSVQFYQARWQTIQSMYRKLHDNQAFPWPRTERFTSPVYSLLDPWMPGRDNAGDTTAGMKPYHQCLTDFANTDVVALCTIDGQTLQECAQNFIPSCGVVDLSIFSNYFNCLEFVTQTRLSYPAGTFPTLAVCEQFYPLPPLLPQPPDTKHDADMVLDFTAFREPQRTVKLPILKPIQIRINFRDIEPPPLEQDEEPAEYPVLAPLPEFPDAVATAIVDALPIVINPAGQPGLDSFREAAVLSVRVETALGDPFPKIKMPATSFLDLIEFLRLTEDLIRNMTQEYTRFWNSLILKKCSREDTSGNCVKSGTEHDCVQPYFDPFGKCVHFEADLNERFQKIGSRPPIFLKDDLRAIGKFREPIIHGQTYCEREDWACQLYNTYERKPREGWMLDSTDDYNPEDLMRDARREVREQSDNIIMNPDERFLYDIPQEEIFENFRVPEGELIERYIERFQPEPLEPGEVCNDAFCEIPAP